MPGPAVDSTSCPALPRHLPPYPDNLQSSALPWRTHRHAHARAALRFKLSPAAAAVSARKTPVSLPSAASRRRAAVVLAQIDQTETAADLPSLPYSSNQSLSVESWGSVYTGPHEAKYWNSNRKFPYAVGFTSIKIYKGKTFLQKIEEGAEGPVFTVVIVGENKSFASKSPQKVWNDVVESDGQHVQGARHFGFQSHDVIAALQKLPQSRSGVSNEEASSDGKLVSSVNLTPSNKKGSIVQDFKSETDNELGLVESIFNDDSDEERLAGFDIESEEDALEEDEDHDTAEKGNALAVKLQDDEGEDMEAGEDEEDKDEEDEDDAIEEDILLDPEDHNVNANLARDLESDDDNDHDVEDDDDEDDEEEDDEEEEEEEEDDDDNERDALSYDEYPASRRVHIDDDSPAFDDTGPLRNNYKRSLRSTNTASSFEKFGRFDSADESYKEDLGAVNNNVYFPSSQGRSKVVGRVWRKGDSIVTRGRQPGIERVGSENRSPATDGPQLRASMALNSNTRAWDTALGKKREENTRSSQMLLELLKKWNKTRNWKRDSNASLQKRADVRNLKLRVNNQPHQDGTWRDERVYTAVTKPASQNRVSEAIPFPLRGKTSSKNHEGVRPMQSSQENAEFTLEEFQVDEDVDESTEFAITKLFETVGKKETGSAASEISSSLGKIEAESGQKLVNHVEKSGIRSSVGRSSDIEEYQGMELTDDRNSYSELGDVVRLIKDRKQIEREPSLRLEKKLMNGEVLLTSKQKDLGKECTDSIKRGFGPVDKKQAEEMKLIDSIRKLVGSKRYEDAFLALKSAKSGNLDLHAGVYESLLGDVQLAEWQKEVFRQVQHGNSVLVSAPSGAGKTVVADCCLFRNYIEEHRSLIVTPLEHSAKEKIRALGSIFGQHHVGGLTTRTQKDHKIVVLTLDSLAQMLQELHGPGGSEFRFFFEGINFVVLDKLHTIGGSKYVNMWEEVFMLMDSKIKVLGLSLPTSNEDQFVSWLNVHRGPCKLVSCRTESLMKRFLFCNGNGIFPLLDTEGVRLREGLQESSAGYRNSMTKEQLDFFFLSGYDKSSLIQALVSLRSNAMLPALVVFSNIVGCTEAMQDAFASLGDCLLSDQELAKLEARCTEIGETHPGLMENLEQADREALRRGFAACHEGKLPAWQAFVLNLFQENVLKLLLVSESVILQTGIMARTTMLAATCRVMKDGVLPLTSMQALPLFGSAGRKGYDVEGNVVFLQNYISGPSEAAALALKKEVDIVSNFKPTYSLVANLMAKYPIAKVKQLLSGTFHDIVYYNTHVKEKLLHAMGKKILDCLESKGDLEIKLFRGLAEVNKQKLADAAVFTRVDIRSTLRSASHGGNVFPGFLLAVVPERMETFYMIFGADNNFHLLPAGAIDHVYRTESAPLDVLYKQSTGQILQPPAIPPKERWTIEHEGTGSYVATGNTQTQWFAKLLMDYPVHMTAVKEGLQIRKEIVSLDSEILSLIEKRMIFRGKEFGDMKTIGSQEITNGVADEVDESDTWKEAMRLLKIMVQADALSLTESQGAYVKLKPLGMLISRLHFVDNELWLAMVLTLSHVRQLASTEFMAIIAAAVPLEADVESLFNDQKDFTYRATKPLKDAFTKLEVLRKHVAALQGSLTPPLHLSVAFAGMVSAWARSKPGIVGFDLESTNDGEIAWKLKSVGRCANLISRACTQVSVDMSEPNDFSSLSMLAKKAEELLSKHLLLVD